MTTQLYKSYTATDGNCYFTEKDKMNPLTVILHRNSHQQMIAVSFCDEDANADKWVKKTIGSTRYWKDGKGYKYETLLQMYKVNTNR